MRVLSNSCGEPTSHRIRMDRMNRYQSCSTHKQTNRFVISAAQQVYTPALATIRAPRKDGLTGTLLRKGNRLLWLQPCYRPMITPENLARW
jgi:hypothetical protein